MFGRSKLNKRRNKRSPRTILIWQIFVGVSLITLIVLLGVVVWHLSRVESLTINSVEVIGGETISHDIVRSLVEEQLEGEYYKLVPKRFAWTFPKDKIEEKIMSIERMKNVHVERKSGTELVVVFEEYTPSALWCYELDSSKCLFLDKNGFAFAKAPRLEGAAFIRFSEKDREPELFTSAFGEEFIKNSETLMTLAYEELNLNIIQVEKTAEDEITYYISGGGQLKVSLRMSPRETIDNLKTILHSDEFSHIVPGNFQYIDLRYGNKIFVNEEPIDKNVSTSTSLGTSTIR